MSLLIVGCGYVGMQVAAAWRASGQSVAAVTRGGQARISDLTREGIEPIAADWLDANGAWTLPAARSVLVAVPHRPDPRWGSQTYCQGLANLSARLSGVERLVMLSTTGVYHQCDGQWVDETSPTLPTRPGPQVALAAEGWIADHYSAAQATVLRLAGIYGPGRVPLVNSLRKQEPIPVTEGTLNLIHIDDISRVLVRLLAEPAQQNLYVLADGHPVARRTFYEEAARIFATPPPIFVAPVPGSSRAGRGESNKRINPQRILDDLQLALRYPNYLVGLSAIAGIPG